MLKALRQSESLFSRYYLNEEFNDVMFTFELRDDIVIGQPFRYLALLTKQSTREDCYEFFDEISWSHKFPAEECFFSF